jgi:pyroglutamyl-peptidase
MANPVLLTSFDTWAAHQRSNASDDLLEKLLEHSLAPAHAHVIRRIPVDFQRAPATVIAAIETVRPTVVICCGMAEQRSHLTLEAQGKRAGDILTTGLDLELLVQKTIATTISYDAGDFVCNHLYYEVLNYIQQHQLNSQGLFVHVPVLNGQNLPSVLADFLSIVNHCSEHPSRG